jgi:hypothetical protein
VEIEQLLLAAWHPYGAEALQACRKYYPQAKSKSERAYLVMRELKLAIREKYGQPAWDEFIKQI